MTEGGTGGGLTVTAEAPAGVGNVAVGFDILGQALHAPSDKVTLTRRSAGAPRITRIGGVVTDLPRDPEANAATAGILRMLADAGIDPAIDVEIDKGIPLGSGMGGSAASAVAGVVAANTMFDLRLGDAVLLDYALDGEAVAAGARHPDNVAAALLGGLVMTLESRTGSEMYRLPLPNGLSTVLVHPHYALETRASRRAVPGHHDQARVVAQNARLAGFIHACHTGDVALLRQSLRDVLIEPHRANLIPGFDAVKTAALDAGAIGCSISGGGPSVFAWCVGALAAETVGASMRQAFGEAGLDSDVWLSQGAAPGARVVAK